MKLVFLVVAPDASCCSCRCCWFVYALLCVLSVVVVWLCWDCRKSFAFLSASEQSRVWIYSSAVRNACVKDHVEVVPRLLLGLDISQNLNPSADVVKLFTDDVIRGHVFCSFQNFIKGFFRKAKSVKNMWGFEYLVRRNCTGNSWDETAATLFNPKRGNTSLTTCRRNFPTRVKHF